MGVFDFKIGTSRKAREEMRGILSRRKVMGVYRTATMMGYRDANLINNYGKRYNTEEYDVPASFGEAIGELYSLPDKPDVMKHAGVVGTLDNVGGIIGLTDLEKSRENNLSYNMTNSDNSKYKGRILSKEDEYHFPIIDKVRKKACALGDEERIFAFENNLLEYHRQGQVKRPVGWSESTGKNINPERVLTKLNDYKGYGKDTAYGVSLGENDADAYSLPNNMEETSHYAADKAIINTDYTKGKAFTSEHGNDVISYNFYDEASRDTSKDTGSSGMSDGSNFSFFNDGELMKLPKMSILARTSELFKNGKIKTIVSRFHTDNDIDNGELKTAYNENYGFSRGRNLLKKTPDKPNGYDNPYCRVWTTHHQYASLKDRIRPFIDGDNNFMSIKETQEKLVGDLRPNKGNERLNEHSSLMNNGYVRIAPTRNGGEYNNDIKKCMFSIENLAWRDVHIDENLTKEQRGPNKGRIMWFPPYNLKFQENTTANWSENDFIGRGESIYTYTNTVRNGNLSFTMLIDHPSIMNKWRGMGEPDGDEKYKDEQTLLRFFGGCDDLSDDMSNGKNTTTEEEPKTTTTEPKPVESTQDVKYIIFFPNDFSSIDQNDGESVITNLKKYEYDSGVEWGTGRDSSYDKEILREKNKTNKNSDYLFNKSIEKGKELIIKELGIDGNDELHSFDDLINLKGMEQVLHMDPQNPDCSNQYTITGVDVQGFASSHGYTKNNNALCARRAAAIASIVKYKYQVSGDIITRKDGNIIEVNDLAGDKDVNRVDAKIARCAIATFHVKIKGYQGPTTSDGTEIDENIYLNISDAELERRMSEDISGNLRAIGNGETSGGTLDAAVFTADSGKKSASITKTNDSPQYTYDNEYMYFKNLGETDKLSYKNIIDKIQFFSPAYHSITPEGFNARLTFLQQCMRQGPTQTIGNQDGSVPAGNLAFGHAPYCVLRIGDFFNTKIVITNMSIDYDTGTGIQYDLNPEGIGVQPMMANVNLTFNFIGGQDIAGPVDRLQNAVSYNYYANASVYDRHADYYTKYDGEEKVLSQFDAMKPDEGRKEISTRIQ